MDFGPSLGTLAGTLEPTPMCAYKAHIVTDSAIFVVSREDYVYLVPFVEGEDTVFLKTIPGRKATKQYLGEEFDEEA